VQHHVHRGDAKHGDVKVEAVEHLTLDVLPLMGLNQVAGPGFLFTEYAGGIAVLVFNRHLARPKLPSGEVKCFAGPA
jgi:hypothetical protein